ncbi:MAG: hypothetical protein JWO13_319 [Acidobacteriales bacterium]|nr:hypothetical protein [Terriglobales bacterium]
MGSFSPIQIAVVVISVVSLVGVIISFVRNTALLAGYEEYKADIQKIASSLKAEMFRDGNDVVIPGNYKKFPIQVRFSYSENTPGLNIRMQAPVSFTFSVVPKGERATEGRVALRTGDDMFDARFTARTDHPTQAKMLVSSKPIRMQLSKLCCSTKTFLTMVTGNIELSELIIPSPYTARHVLDHVESMAALAAEVEGIPGADKVKFTEYKREKSTPILKIALAVGAVVAIAAVFASPGTEMPTTSAAAGVVHADGVLDADAGVILKLAGWRTAADTDFAGDVAGWMKASGVPATGRIELNLDGTAPTDVVYCLAHEQDSSKRIVILENGVNILDTVMPDVVGLVRIPKNSMSNIEWSQKPATESDGDGLMVIRRKDDKTTATVFSRTGGRTVTGTVANYETVNIAE